MPAKKQTKPITTLEKIESLIKKLWLANLGICSRSIDEIQNRYDRLNEDSQRFFDELINKGESVESNAKNSLDANRKKLGTRIDKLKQKLTFKSDFSSKLDEVNAKLDKLSEMTSTKA